MAFKVRPSTPGRLTAIRQTVAVPTTNTGGQLTHNNRVKPLSARSVNASSLPLTVQRQTPSQPLKRNKFS
jgi:hypothetical protein